MWFQTIAIQKELMVHPRERVRRRTRDTGLERPRGAGLERIRQLYWLDTSLPD
jgi:hypothetical protein